MVVFYIFLAIALLICLLLQLPVKLKLYIDRNFTYKVLLGPITVISDKQKKSKTTKISDDGGKQKKESYLSKLHKEKGFSGAVVEIISYLKIIFSELSYFLGKIKIRDFLCYVTVSEGDAADTAVSYGVISTAVYGFSGFLDSKCDFGYKKIAVNADYSESESSFELGFTVNIKLLYLIITAFKLLMKFIKLKREV